MHWLNTRLNLLNSIERNVHYKCGYASYASHDLSNKPADNYEVILFNALSREQVLSIRSDFGMSILFSDAATGTAAFVIKRNELLVTLPEPPKEYLAFLQIANGLHLSKHFSVCGAYRPNLGATCVQPLPIDLLNLSDRHTGRRASEIAIGQFSSDKSITLLNTETGAVERRTYVQSHALNTWTSFESFFCDQFDEFWSSR
jgi:hypothetical protein